MSDDPRFQDPRPSSDAGAAADPDRPWNAWLPGGAHDSDDASARAIAGPRIRSVAELTRIVRDRLRAATDLRDVWVEGEIGQVSVSAAGHAYLTLKDAGAQLRCVIFRDDRARIPFEPQTGLKVVVHGRIDVFEQQGAYQLYVDALQPSGFGDLALRLEAMKAKLAAEGLFETARKRPLPDWPRTIGLATSETGAVLHDVVQVLRRRWPLVRVVFAPCLVQGETAPATILGALRSLARWTDPVDGRAIDLLILARGGGSLEDLWPFNDERVVRAVAAFPRPVVVGVGHESDVTLADFAADVRAATPSVAAELAVPSLDDQAARLAAHRRRMDGLVAASVVRRRNELEAERRALEAQRPSALLATERERLGFLLDRATDALTGRLARERVIIERLGVRASTTLRLGLGRARFDIATAQGGLTALSPFATLERGYAIVRTPDGTVVRDATTVRVDDALDVRLAAGGLDVRVERVRDSMG
ncbi:MAG TPA: exodeoxyribonuclease VII large subunit [Candidatus Limnocylindrales bacterium]